MLRRYETDKVEQGDDKCVGAMQCISTWCDENQCEMRYKMLWNAMQIDAVRCDANRSEYKVNWR